MKTRIQQIQRPESDCGAMCNFQCSILNLKLPFLLSLLALLSTLNSQLSAAPLGTAFTYQGRLNDGGAPANGLYDLQFTLYDAPSGGLQIGPEQTTKPVVLSNGLFTVTLDFEFGAFPGDARWLAIAVKTNGPASYTALTPRQPLTPSPHALYAPTAGTAARAATATMAQGVAANAVTAPGIASGQVVKSLNTLKDDVTLAVGANLTLTPSGQTLTLATPADWHLSGNSGTIPGTHFLGTTDGQPLEIKVNGLRAWRVEFGGDSADGDTLPDGAANVIGGSPVNFVAAGVAGATIAGGGATNYAGFARTNAILDHYGAIGGGLANVIGTNSEASTIGGGYDNAIGANSWHSTVGGGIANNIGTVSAYSTIGGGLANEIGTDSPVCTVGGGGGNSIGTNSHHSTVAGGVGNEIGANSTRSTIGGGYDNAIGDCSYYSTIAGGYGNAIGNYSYQSAIAGGLSNNIGTSSYSSTIAGGYTNAIGTSSPYSTIGGGSANEIAPDALYATIPGGRANYATNYAFAAGRGAHARHTGSFVWGDSTDSRGLASSAADQFTVRASGGVRFFSNGALTSGVKLDPGDTSWSSISDRNVKKHRTPVDGPAVLEKLAALPVEWWRYQWEADDSPPHLGPMAQDFKQAFYPGRDDTQISTLEFDGVALAAIQGLNQKVEDRSQRTEVRSQKLEAENEALKKEVADLKALVRALAQKVNGGGQ